eukprot:NODE_96_length_21330_cov_0.419858.p3 type:complete len:515 gc:universal NODE_96_length_21330_cov_0.419858:19023-17479(-)
MFMAAHNNLRIHRKRWHFFFNYLIFETMSLHTLSPLQVIQMEINQNQIDQLKKITKPQSSNGHIEVGTVNYAQELIKHWDANKGTVQECLDKISLIKHDILKGHSLSCIFANRKPNPSDVLTLSKQIHHILTYAKLNAQPFTESSSLVLLLKLYRSQPMLGYSLLEKFSKKNKGEWTLPVCFTTCPSTLSARFYYYGAWYLGTVGSTSLALKWIQESMRLVPIPSVAAAESATPGDAMQVDDPVDTNLFKFDKKKHTIGRNGFLLACTKLLIACHLLMGDVPEKSLFKHVNEPSNPLFFYKEICKAVKFGDMQSYSTTLKTNTQVFESDYTFSFMLRLKPAVRKSAIKSIMNVYSCISLKDMAIMITNMSSSRTDGICFINVEMLVDVTEHELEYMVGKCIEEGIVNGSVDHTNGTVYSGMKMPVPILEPGQAPNPKNSSASSSLFDPTISFEKTVNQYHDRITYCHQIHNAAVQAMRYKVEDQPLKDMEQAREKERELINEIEQGDLDDEMDF